MRKTHAIASDTFVSISVVYFLIVESNMLLNTLEENLTVDIASVFFLTMALL